MSSSLRAEDWDEWEEEEEEGEAPVHDAQGSPDAPLPPVASTPDAAGETAWLWSLERLERDLASLPLEHLGASHASDASSFMGSSDDPEVEKLGRILQLADEAALSMAATHERLTTLHTLALVTKHHLLAVQSAFGSELLERSAEREDAAAIIDQLRKSAGPWAVTSLDDATERQMLHETTAALHQALASLDGDLVPFQHVLELVFASLPAHTLSVSTAWLQPQQKTRESRHPVPRTKAASSQAAYLTHLQAVVDPETAPERLVPQLSEAQEFQDAKDVKRDALVVNGEFVAGTMGYAAVVDKLQGVIERTVREVVGHQRFRSASQAHAYATTTRAIAQQLLNACNRTESGGSSYEVLSRVLSTHTTDAILVRPASAKAAPLELRVDVGAFCEASSDHEAVEKELWAFGVRVVLSAVTWYLVCEADDPTNELVEVKTTYENRLAFPLGLTPFHPLSSMRKDVGVVRLELMLSSRDDDMLSPPMVTRAHRETAEALDVDELL